MDVEDELRRKTLKAGHRLLVVVLAALVVWAFWHVRTVAIPVLIAVFIASATVPPAHWLMRRGLHPAAATAAVWLGLVAVAALLVTLLIPVTVSGIDELTFNLDRFVARLQSTAVRFGLDETSFTDLGDQIRQWLADRSERIAGGALTGVIATGEVLIGAVLALVLAIYFTHGGPNLLVWLTDLLPESSREETRAGASIVFHVVGRYMRGVALVGFVDGFFIGLGLLVLGIPLAIPLAMLTWIGAFLPIVGAFLAGLLAAVVAFIAKGWLAALAVIAITIAVQQVEGHILAPQIYGRALDLPSAVILMAIALGSTLAGITGAFLAAPVTSAVVAVLHHRAELRRMGGKEPEPAAGPRDEAEERPDPDG